MPYILRAQINFICIIAEWLADKQERDGIPDIGPNFDVYSKEYLNDLLCTFYAEIRNRQSNVLVQLSSKNQFVMIF